MEAATATMPPVDLEKTETAAFLQNEVCAQESTASAGECGRVETMDGCSATEVEADAANENDQLAPMRFDEDEEVWVKIDEQTNEKVENNDENCHKVESGKTEENSVENIDNNFDVDDQKVENNKSVETDGVEQVENNLILVGDQKVESDMTQEQSLDVKVESNLIIVEERNMADGQTVETSVAEMVSKVIIVDGTEQKEVDRTEGDLPLKLELHISESDLVDKPDETNEALTIETAEGKDAKEIYSCQSSPGYIKPPTKSTIVKQRSLDTQGTSDDESEVGRSKRGSLHSPSSKILIKMTPITWDQWMKRPASYVPPVKSPDKDGKEAATEVDGGKSEEKKDPAKEEVKKESPIVKKTRFQIIPQSADVLEINRDEPKVLETFDETEEDKFLLENPNVLVESHLNQLTMVESQLKKLGAAAKVGVCTKRLGQPEPDQKNMGRASSGDQKSKGWLGWLSVFTKRPTPPSPPVKKQPVRKPCPQHSRPQARQHARPAGPILANYDPKMITVIEVGPPLCV